MGHIHALSTSRYSGECGAAPTSGLPAISPTRGEIGCGGSCAHHHGTRLAKLPVGVIGLPRVDLPPCGGDGRQARGG
ncbi:hypothetical protein AOX55_00002117 [Sinorhizobium fredii CCBAU 25509]|nr:hypothetical protein AOX55_00002117 [Sinorhizobium fredii CCBAU 25509]